MYTFILAAEGQTDIDALTVLLKKLAEQCQVECHFTPPIFPSGDATAGRGWSALKTYCEEYSGIDRKTTQQTIKDKEIFTSMGLTSPPRVGRSRWPAVQAFSENPVLVFHLDGDIAEEIGAHHPEGAFSAAHNRADYCRKALQHWTNLAEDSAVWCVPVQCLETWFLTLHTAEVCQKHLPEMADYESIPNNTVYRLLCTLGHPKFIDTEGNTTVDKIALAAQAKLLADSFDKVCTLCPSAARFVADVKTRLSA